MFDATPLVSVLMPAYNEEEKISLSLASLMAQSYENWECIVVDDGSCDNTSALVSRISILDQRIKLIRLERNYGRGVARQVTLENASGDYVTMLDADDWLYPNKLEIQVSFLEKNKDVTLHSMSMAIVDKEHLVSVRRPETNIDRVVTDLRRLFIPHAPSMIRHSDIKGFKYDPRFKYSQDQDFLRRILINKRYVVSKEVGYCYSEIESVNITKIIKSYCYSSFGYLKLIGEFKLQALFFFFIGIAKIPYTLFRYLFLGERKLIESRSSKLLKKDQCDFEIALEKVKRKLNFINLN